jgi:DegV family protein with EDD domain
MSKVAIVTDSSSHIPEELTEGLPVSVLPLHLVWGEKSYRDNIDIREEEFYRRLQAEKVLPRTSQSSFDDIMKVYQPLVDQGYEILSIHISSRFTNNMENVKMTTQTIAGAVIEFFDSRSSAMEMGFQVLAAARAAVQGANLHTCMELAEKARRNSTSLFTLSTLEFLRRGGRIGNASAFLGSLLDIKPILGTLNGTIEAIERVRTMGKARDRIVQLLKERVGDHAPVRLASQHSNLPDAALDLLDRAVCAIGKQRIVETVVCGISPVLGTHMGPGGIGISCVVET